MAAILAAGFVMACLIPAIPDARCDVSDDIQIGVAGWKIDIQIIDD